MKAMTLEEFLTAAHRLATGGKWQVREVANGHLILVPQPTPAGFIHCDLVTAVCLEQTGITRSQLRKMTEDLGKERYFEWTMAAEILGLPFALLGRILGATSSCPPATTFTWVVRGCVRLPAWSSNLA